jgi:hypothetical protein
MIREHMEVVLQGNDAITVWRQANPNRRLDLSGADLPRAKLAEVDLSRANLSKTNLMEADLSGTLLHGANLAHAVISGAQMVQSDLFKANLTSANLSDADLSAATMSQANLSGADLSATQCYVTDLSGAVLSSADLSFATLDRANLDLALFSGATFNETVFADCDLSRSLGLDSVQHLGPSTLGLDTLVRSRGDLPAPFLRGAGVPDHIVNYMRELNGGAPPFYTCFITHADEDQEFAIRLAADLQSRGVRCWTYRDTAALGPRIYKKSDRTLRVYDKLLVICSKDSLQHNHVLREMERALLKEQAIARGNDELQHANGNGPTNPRLREPQVLFLVRLDDYVADGWQHARKMEVARRTIGNFAGWSQNSESYQQSLSSLLNLLNATTWPVAKQIPPEPGGNGSVNGAGGGVPASAAGETLGFAQDRLLEP